MESKGGERDNFELKERERDFFLKKYFIFFKKKPHMRVSIP